MGNDLSLVLRACVPVADLLHEQQLHSSDERKEGSDILHSYTELRLVEGNSFNPQTLIALSDGTALSPTVAAAPLRLLVAECSPQTLSMLDFRDSNSFFFLHEELRCSQCAGRIGLVVDPSVCIGQRLYTAEQRYLFTQSLFIFLSKFVLLLKEPSITDMLDKAVNTLKDTEVPGDLVRTRPNTPSKENSQLRHELFLVDLQHGLLDDVSGPWIVRDIIDHMGRTLHHHSAVSRLCGQHSFFSTRSRSLQDTPITKGIVSSGGRIIIHPPSTLANATTTDTTDSSTISVSAGDENADQTLPPPDPAQFVFCSSLRQINLSHNNMSLVGLRKCLIELLKQSNEEVPGQVNSLEVIDLRRNEESLAAQRLVAEMSSSTNVHILIGNSGRRWRHTQSDSETKFGVFESPSPSAIQYNPPVSLWNCEQLFNCARGVGEEEEKNEVDLDNMLRLRRQLDLNESDIMFSVRRNGEESLLPHHNRVEEKEEEPKGNHPKKLDAILFMSENVSASLQNVGKRRGGDELETPIYGNGASEDTKEEGEPISPPFGNNGEYVKDIPKDPIINEEVMYTDEPPILHDDISRHLHDVSHDMAVAVAVGTVEVLPVANIPKVTTRPVISPSYTFPPVSKGGNLASDKVTEKGGAGNSPIHLKKATPDSPNVKRSPPHGGVGGSKTQKGNSKRSHRPNNEVISLGAKSPEGQRGQQNITNKRTKSPAGKHIPQKKEGLQTTAAVAAAATTATATKPSGRSSHLEKQRPKSSSRHRSKQ
ncbi:hypothetical protein LSM04_007876 [Trypanosoma melophagium]|uniref:uncharacterized protein n=1 Tax=Trypanosoma melophagium TaxID=715481 RepID=UPI00351A7598|nr:hypothetical protein LSM04_007876 [Trypanosoma melophagium]